MWIVHAERQELEVLQPGVGSVVYRRGTEVPLPLELDKYGLATMPVTALFDEREASRFNDEWEGVQTRAQTIVEVLRARGLAVPEYVRARARVRGSSGTGALAGARRDRVVGGSICGGAGLTVLTRGLRPGWESPEIAVQRKVKKGEI